MGFKINGQAFETDAPINKEDYLNQWVNIAYSYNSSNGQFKLYRNGVLQSTISRAGAWTYGGGATPLIGSSMNKGEWLDADVASHRLYNVALSDEDIRALYELTKP